MKIGDCITCINDKFSLSAAKKFRQLPIAGKNYLIRGIRPMSQGKVGLLLEEIINPQILNSKGKLWEPDYDSDRFSIDEDIPSLENILKSLEPEPIYVDY
jgi:hypothetical protein